MKRPCLDDSCYTLVFSYPCNETEFIWILQMWGWIPVKGSVFFKQFITILQQSQQPKDMVMLNRMVILAIGQST